MLIKRSKIVYEEQEIACRPLKLNKNANIFKFVKSIIGADNSPTEYLMVVALDDDAKPVSYYLMGNSSEDEVSFTMTSVLRFVILSGADYFITIHNHPNDVGEFSTEDIKTAIETKKKAQMLGLKMVGDYLIANKKCIKNRKL